MNLKEVRCPNCGGKMKYNDKKHIYKCEYCDASYKDVNENVNNMENKSIDSHIMNDSDVKLESIGDSKEMKKAQSLLRWLVSIALIVPVVVLIIIIFLINR